MAWQMDRSPRSGTLLPWLCRALEAVRRVQKSQKVPRAPAPWLSGQGEQSPGARPTTWPRRLSDGQDTDGVPWALWVPGCDPGGQACDPGAPLITLPAVPSSVLSWPQGPILQLHMGRSRGGAGAGVAPAWGVGQAGGLALLERHPQERPAPGSPAAVCLQALPACY